MSNAAHFETFFDPTHHTYMAHLALTIENMHCGACVRRVLLALNALPETHADEVAIGSAKITTSASPDQIQQTLAAAGYPATISSNTP
jgi:copper chaperone CopZ